MIDIAGQLIIARKLCPIDTNFGKFYQRNKDLVSEYFIL